MAGLRSFVPRRNDALRLPDWRPRSDVPGDPHFVWLYQGDVHLLIDPHQLFRAIVVLNALFASLAWCLARTNRASVLSVLTFAFLWPFVDKPLGGRTVYVINEGNGITTGDFLSVFAVLAAAVLAALQFRRVRRRRAELLGDEEPLEQPEATSITGTGLHG